MQELANKLNAIFGTEMKAAPVKAEPVIRTASDLKYYVESAGHESHFFDRSSMRFFGDTMRNYAVRKVTVQTNWDENGLFVGKAGNGLMIQAYELVRRRPVKHGNQDSAYFDAKSFRRVYPASE